MKKRLLSARIPLAIFSLIFSMVGSSYAAQIISVNVMAGSGRNVMSGSDAAGAPGVRTNNWNELSSTDSSLAAGAVIDASGAVVAGMSVDLSAGGNFSDRGAGDFGDNMMINTVIDKYQGTPGTLEVRGVPYDAYNVYFYHRPENGDGLDNARGGYFSLSSSGGTEQRRYISTQDKTTASQLSSGVNADGSGYIQSQTTNISSSDSFSQIDGGHYVKFSWVSGTNFTVQMSALGDGAADDLGNVILDGDGARRLKWSGFQIEEIPSGTATSLSLTESLPGFIPGDPQAYSVRVFAEFDSGSNGLVNGFPELSFESLNTNIFLVTENGFIQPQSSGTADLIIDFQTLSITQTVTVLAPISLSPPEVVTPNLFVSGGVGGSTITRLEAIFPGPITVDVTECAGTAFDGGPSDVVTVTPRGTVNAVGEGSFEIIGYYEGLSITHTAAGSVSELELSAMNVTSPDGRLVLDLAITNFDGSADCVVYRVFSDADVIVEPSRLGLTFNGEELRENLAISGWTTNAQDIIWEPVYGERSYVRDHYHERTVYLTETVSPYRQLWVTLRAYDEGVAFSYTIPEQGGFTEVDDLTEQTEFRFRDDHTTWSVTSAQGTYTKTTVNALPSGCERPLVVEMSTNRYVAVSEARLVDYARMKFNPLSGVTNAIVSALHSSVDLPTPLTTPWRVVMAADRPGELLENNGILLNLNDPCAIEDTSWIKPGKVIREVTLSTEGGMACIDFAASNGLQYIEYDAGWYGPEGSTIDATEVDSSRDLDLQAVIDYGASKGVGVIVYVNKVALANQIEFLPALYNSWGIKGIKFGFVNVGSQSDTAWLHEAIRICATNEIMVDVHDEYRVTGYERTYPNLMTVEGIGGDETTPSPTKTLDILFNRMITGAGDHTVCYFSSRVFNDWTHAYQLAKAVCFYSPLQFLYWYDRPVGSPDYEDKTDARITDEAELAFWAAMPAVWDETRVLAGSSGEYAVIARRSGEEWYMGAMNAGQTRTFPPVSFDFLNTNQVYEATRYSHDATLTTRTQVKIETFFVDASTRAVMTFDPAEGEAWRMVPVARPAFSDITMDSGVVRLSVTGYAGVPVTLWTSDDLGQAPVNWTELTNALLTSDALEILDGTHSTSNASFYRLSVP
jgi:alpha-glucosidase